MEARSATALTDVTPTGSQTQVLTPEEIPDHQVNKCLDKIQEFKTRKKDSTKTNSVN